MAIRVQWAELPFALTEWVASQLGGPVIAATSQSNGFSSGAADRIKTAHGRKAFVKAISREHNAGAYELHSREASVMQSLPASVCAPKILGAFNDGEWVALLIEDIEGRHPDGSLGEDVRTVLDALADLPPATGELSRLSRLSEDLQDDFDGWTRLLLDNAEGSLPDAALKIGERMVSTSAHALDAAHGDNLVHADCRSDNVLLDQQGSAWILDWPWASIGAAWFDGLTYLLDVSMRNKQADLEAYLDHRVFDGMSPNDADAVLAGLAGNWYDKARLPAPPDMPTLRAFQKAEANAAVTWLSRRWA